MEKINKQLTIENLRDEFTATLGILEALDKVLPVTIDPELLSFLDVTRKSPVNLQIVLNLLQPPDARR